jgi:hypothetical protein
VRLPVSDGERAHMMMKMCAGIGLVGTVGWFGLGTRLSMVSRVDQFGQFGGGGGGDGELMAQSVSHVTDEAIGWR